MIDKVYINEAVRIRKQYVSCLLSIYTKEEKIVRYKDEIQDIYNEMETIVKKMDENDLTSKTKLNDMLNDIEININKVKEELRPIDDEIEKLKKQSITLFENICEKYPTLDKEDIKKYVQTEVAKTE